MGSRWADCNEINRKSRFYNSYQADYAMSEIYCAVTFSISCGTTTTVPPTAHSATRTTSQTKVLRQLKEFLSSLLSHVAGPTEQH